MSELFNDMMVESMQAQERKVGELTKDIAELKEMAKVFPSLAQLIAKLELRLISLEKKLAEVNFPVRGMQTLSNKVEEGIIVWQKPKEIIHHYHVHKLMYITAGLILILVLVCAGWLMTHDQLSLYKEHDIKYRHLQFVKSPDFQGQLKIADSLYRQNADQFSDSVIVMEEELARQIRLAKEINRTKEELEELQKKAGNSSRQP
ncbi:hypothetical protein HB364_08700 [Pseudoflavitalea sp. X16]|uniref:hypothetical protein n=1 Tax=Paraflavitalea devenefica TaxID=2716334 RepID=UPI001421EB78|nr:hypothetical protein [Paraflavitalea devenefica]NII25156.1 hypothetical protein [Paraflavitalea devenefica]